MQPSPLIPSFQAHFHSRWGHLSDPHVRAMAWLLDAPDLLDPRDPLWQGKVATLGPIDQATADWLTGLDQAPEALHAYLNLQPFSRLGRYAEKLMAFYLEHQGILVAHGVQVRGENKETIGEFDFLLRQEEGLVHWEFASKFYLLENGGVLSRKADYFVGPNLADTLGKKIRKIMEQQLYLSQHPAARRHLPAPIHAAQALVKGWLFYHEGSSPSVNPPGVSPSHCRGFWCSLSELERWETGELYVVLPRLSWLAPAKVPAQQALKLEQLKQQLTGQFEIDKAPALVAAVQIQDGWANETDRGFIVPDEWHVRAKASASEAAADPV
ncbi:DUF1853 family protein [Noviherbaspirillum massiliense]|uniref:DUF1853 family protein n=1 Tax=Noviherbaspirillum massiliense TaxID=1465823 RepID=UPI00031375DC|nr:DUF1853 family protein [Noviherbaspirillum massiliense]